MVILLNTSEFLIVVLMQYFPLDDFEQISEGVLWGISLRLLFLSVFMKNGLNDMLSFFIMLKLIYFSKKIMLLFNHSGYI